MFGCGKTFGVPEKQGLLLEQLKEGKVAIHVYWKRRSGRLVTAVTDRAIEGKCFTRRWAVGRLPAARLIALDRL